MDIYKDHKASQCIRYHASMGEGKAIVDSFPRSSTWRILSGQDKKILGYNCTLAESVDGTGRAYFTQEIPISDGPSIYYGLPGLILYYESSHSIFQAESIEYLQAELEIELPAHNQDITIEQFRAVRG